MKTIHNIKIEKTFYKRVKDNYGNVYREPYQKFVLRSVKTVTSGTRFGYYLIDAIAMYMLNYLIQMLILMIINLSAEIDLALGMFTIFTPLIYYFVMETFFGQTIGKMLLGYVVINDYANQPSVSEVAIRTICRIIPFEAFSCLSDTGWHDRFSNTWVVSKTEKDLLTKHLGKVDEINTELIDNF